MVSESFINMIDISDPDLDLVIKLMRHPNKDDACKLLHMINSVMNHYMTRQEDEVRYPIVYIPTSEPWAQEVCIEFITLKLSLIYNDLTKKRLDTEIGIHDCIFLPEKCSKKKHNELRSIFRYKKGIYRLIKDKPIVASNSKKNVIVCNPFADSTPHNPFLHNLCGAPKTLIDQSWALCRIDPDIKNKNNPLNKLKNKTFKDSSIRIENLLVFLSRSTNGRFSETYTLQRPYIERLNKLGAGIKNVFYFYFSTKPYKLQRQLDWKLRNAADISHENAKDMRDFISISSEESDYIFGRVRKQKNLIVKIEDCDDFLSLVNDAIDSIQYSVQVRNTLAICCDEDSQKMFKSEYRDIIEDLEEHYFDIFFNMIQDAWKKQILPSILDFLGGQKDVTLILDPFIPDGYKNHLVSLLRSQGICAVPATFKSMNYTRIRSNNLHRKIVALSFQGHYVGRPYSRYPNSFDPIFLEEGQEILNIFNSFVFNPYYAVHNYEYLKISRNTLFSNFRNSMKLTIALPEKPKCKIEDSKDYSIYHNGNRTQSYQNYKRYTASIGNGKSIKLAESDYIIFKEHTPFSAEQILPVSSLNTLMEETDQSFLISPLSSIQDTLNYFLKQKEDDIRESELYIRQDPRYAFTDDEILSESEVWKILLIRKVKQKGSDAVFSEMHELPEAAGISRSKFERWREPSDNMILPRSRTDQEALFKYLHIAAPYDRIIRRKKAQKGSNTEQKNNMLRSFLCNNLFTDDYKQSFERLSDNLKDMLSIDNEGDFEALIDLLRKEIKFIEIKSLTLYDKN